VVIPTYNEAENLEKLVSALLDIPINLHILIVDDNSPDGTGLLADRLSSRLPGSVQVIHRTGKLGLSSAYLQAFQKLITEKVDAIAHMDADFSHDPASLLKMVEYLDKYDVVVGSRYIHGGSTDETWPLWRKALSAWGNFYARTILGLPVRDVTGGYRIWRRETLEHMPLEKVKSSGYVFMVEMIYLAHSLNYKIREVPIHFQERRFGKSKVSFKIQVEAALRVWQVLFSYRNLNRKKK
jgi:dolichol-phosphate mannosyltransferase